MQPTHPPTQVGEWSTTRVVPAEFGGRGGAEPEAPTKKTDPRVSRRKLLLGVGGLAGVAVAGGGAYAALGGKDKSGGGQPATKAAVSTGAVEKTSAPSNVAATGGTSATSASSPDSPSSSSASAPESPSTPDGTQPPLTPGSAPVGRIEIPGQPWMNFVFVNGGKHLVVTDDENGVQIFDVSNPGGAAKVASIATPLSDGKLKPMLSIDYSAARGMLALGGEGGMALWDVKDPAKPVQLSARADINGKKVNHVAFNGDGSKLVVAADDSDFYSDNAHGSCVLDVTDPRQPAQTSSLTPTDRDSLEQVMWADGGKHLVSVGRGEDSSSALYQLWDASDLHNVHPVDSTAWWDKDTTKLVATMYMVSGGPWNTLVVGVVSADSKSQDLQFLDFGKPQGPAKQWYFQSTSGAAGFHPTRPVVAIGDARSGATTVYDMTDPRHPTTVTRLVADAGDVVNLRFSPDGGVLAAALKRESSGSSNSGAVIYFWKM